MSHSRAPSLDPTPPLPYVQAHNRAMSKEPPACSLHLDPAQIGAGCPDLLATPNKQHSGPQRGTALPIPYNPTQLRACRVSEDAQRKGNHRGARRGRKQRGVCWGHHRLLKSQHFLLVWVPKGLLEAAALWTRGPTMGSGPSPATRLPAAAGQTLSQQPAT